METLLIALLVLFLLGGGAGVTLVGADSGPPNKAFAPGQVKKAQGTQSAKEFAPGQVKKAQGAQSAKKFAPGQVKKAQGTQSAKEFAPGQVKKP
jgi:hypothetical protein